MWCTTNIRKCNVICCKWYFHLYQISPTILSSRLMYVLAVYLWMNCGKASFWVSYVSAEVYSLQSDRRSYIHWHCGGINSNYHIYTVHEGQKVHSFWLCLRLVIYTIEFISCSYGWFKANLIKYNILWSPEIISWYL